jgi:hypothetical protein
MASFIQLSTNDGGFVDTSTASDAKATTIITNCIKAIDGADAFDAMTNAERNTRMLQILVHFAKQTANGYAAQIAADAARDAQFANPTEWDENP